MASTATVTTAKDSTDRLIAGKTYKMMLLTGTSTSWQTAATAKDFQFVADIVADEASDASYDRQPVTLSTAQDDTNDRAEISYSTTTYPSLTESEIKGVVVYEEVNDDSDHRIRFIHDTDAVANNVPNGSDFVVVVGAQGAVHVEMT
jgi:hypothetical protein